MWALHRVITHWLYYMYLLCEITSSHQTLAILHVLVMWDYNELSHTGYITRTVMWDYTELSHTGYITCTCYVRFTPSHHTLAILHVLVMWGLHRVITHWLYYMYLLCEIYTESSHTGYITCICYVRLQRVITQWLYNMYLLCEITPSYHTLAILHVLVMWDYIEASHTGYITCICYVRLHRVITHWLYFMYLLCEIYTELSHTGYITCTCYVRFTPSYHTLAILHVLVM